MPIELLSAPASRPSIRRCTTLQDARLNIEAKDYLVNYNKRPFGFSHNFHELDIFQFDAICDLAARYSKTSENDYFVAGSSATAGSAFFEAEHIKLKPREAIEKLDQRPTRILLKRLENHSEQFRLLKDLIVKQLRMMPGGLGDLAIRRVQSSLFITSAAATTALHFDPEVAFFTQIEGDKEYHVYPPTEVSEPELEGFYSKGRVSIGQLDITKLNPAQENVYNLKAGTGFHQPQNAPHWVQTHATRSISYSLVFETSADKALGLTRAFNHYERKLHLRPAEPGSRPQLDAIKSTMIAPVRFANKVANKLRNG